MTKMIDLTGQKFGTLVVVTRTENSGKHVTWICACDCGGSAQPTTTSLRSGRTLTCGATVHRIERAVKAAQAAGRAVGAKRHDLYQVWKGMRQRCEYQRSASYQRYGAKGITVCEEWKDFWRFVADVGPRPSRNHQLDRIRGSEGYAPGNVRWATAGENSRNRDFVKLTDETAAAAKRLLQTGESLRGIASIFGVSKDCIYDIQRNRTWKHVQIESPAISGVQQGAM